MKIKYLQAMAGTYYTREVGVVADVDDVEGASLVAAGFAEAADEGSEAADEGSEAATPSASKRRTRGRG